MQAKSPAPAKNQVVLAMPTDGKEVQAHAVLDAAKALVVSNQAEYLTAVSFVQQIKTNAAELDKERVEWKSPLDQLAKKVQSLFKPAIDMYGMAENIAKRKIIDYQNEQERIRREEQRKADEAARKKQEQLQARAAKAAESGKIEKAVELEQQATSIVAPIINRAPPKVTGVSTRSVWRYEVEDESKLPREYMTRDDKKIGGVVRALKEKTNIPGVRVWEDKTIAAGAA